MQIKRYTDNQLKQNSQQMPSDSEHQQLPATDQQLSLPQAESTFPPNKSTSKTCNKTCKSVIDCVCYCSTTFLIVFLMHQAIIKPSVIQLESPYQNVTEAARCNSPSYHSQLLASVLSDRVLKRSQYYNVVQKNYLHANYQIYSYPEKPICVLVPSYNNQANNRVINNIQSIVSQQYQNYRLLVIDDASTDQTYNMLSEFVDKLNPALRRKITLKKNQAGKGAMYNFYDAAHNFCHQDDIMTIIDGDDFLLGKQVFKLFNAMYSKQDLWFIYSNSIMYEGLIGYSGEYPEYVFKQRTFRYYHTFLMHHQHSFYTKLFRKIKLEDCKDENGQWLATASDLAIYFPMAEMAGKHLRYLPQITYFYTIDTGINDHTLHVGNQRKMANFIMNKPIYQALQSLD